MLKHVATCQQWRNVEPNKGSVEPELILHALHALKKNFHDVLMFKHVPVQNRVRMTKIKSKTEFFLF